MPLEHKLSVVAFECDEGSGVHQHGAVPEVVPRRNRIQALFNYSFDASSMSNGDSLVSAVIITSSVHYAAVLGLAQRC
jgi:hypothetical protein